MRCKINENPIFKCILLSSKKRRKKDLTHVYYYFIYWQFDIHKGIFEKIFPKIYLLSQNTNFFLLEYVYTRIKRWCVIEEIIAMVILNTRDVWNLRKSLKINIAKLFIEWLETCPILTLKTEKTCIYLSIFMNMFRYFFLKC